MLAASRDTRREKQEVVQSRVFKCKGGLVKVWFNVQVVQRRCV